MAVNGSQSKTCVRCKAEKPLTAFVKRTDRSAGREYGAGCLSCYHSVMAELRKLRRSDPKPAMPLLERFEKYVMPIPWSGCWIWMGGTNQCLRSRAHDCGEMNMKQSDGKWRPEPAYRVAWKIHHGDIPKGMCVLHTCDDRMCVNPQHLFLGTKMENTHDMMRKGRHYTQRISHVC